MYRALIVDDEQTVREGLRTLIGWDELGIEDLYEARTGEEALAWFSDHPCEIVATDIAMPGIGGLELIRCLREMSDETAIVVISGHDDFPLVRQAMRHGIEDYILKPIDPEELTATLTAAIDRIKLRRREGLRRAQGAQIILEHILSKLVTGTAGKHELRRKLDDLQITIPSGPTWVVTCSPTPSSTGSEEIRTDVAQARVDLLAKRLADAPSPHWLFFTEPGGRIVLIATSRTAAEKKEHTAEVVRLIRDIGLSDAIVSVGKTVKSVYVADESYEDALDVESCALLVGRSRVMSREELNDITRRGREREWPSLASLARAVNEGDRKRVDKFFDELARILISPDPRVSEEAAAVLLEIYILFRDTVRQRLLPEERVLGEHIRDGSLILEGTGPRDAALRLREAADRLCEAIRDPDVGPDETIDRILHHIRNNYFESMSLKTISARVGISAPYLGTMIKKETGMLFTRYLNKLRIERAKELLGEGVRKSTEVAHIVGYTDANYFSKVFRKYVGMSPSQYTSPSHQHTDSFG